MDTQLDRLFELLPVIYRQRDAEQGWPLRALLQVIAEQANIVEADIAQLYENWFIETCQDWVVPYLGDLIGYRLVHEAGELFNGERVELVHRVESLVGREPGDQGGLEIDVGRLSVRGVELHEVLLSK